MGMLSVRQTPGANASLELEPQTSLALWTEKGRPESALTGRLPSARLASSLEDAAGSSASCAGVGESARRAASSSTASAGSAVLAACSATACAACQLLAALLGAGSASGSGGANGGSSDSRKSSASRPSSTTAASLASIAASSCSELCEVLDARGSLPSPSCSSESSDLPVGGLLNGRPHSRAGGSSPSIPSDAGAMPPEDQGAAACAGTLLSSSTSWPKLRAIASASC
mmetsp:Transcript_49686/g.107630  ORF Transcript_49686/g.107630 Transcript_49686/m.107630 type:complete len:229 (+) Transcript_49686:842-1528(+)